MKHLPVLLFALLVCASSTPAADAPKREPAAVLKTGSGSVLGREAAGKEWVALKKDAEVSTGDVLIGLQDATLVSKNGAAGLRFITDLSNRSPFPLIETAIRLVPSKDADIDLWLDRGRVELTNLKDKGKATVVVRFRTRVWTMVLEKPGTRVLLQTYSRWPEGTHFTDKPMPTDAPVTSTLLVVLKGEVQRSCSLCSFAMTAPPGPAMFGWDSVNGDDSGPKRLETVPDWVADLPDDTPEAKTRAAARENFRKTLLEQGLGEALVGLLDSPVPEIRRIGVYALGAFDQLPTLGDLLARSKDTETWNNAVVALRHWLGRAPGQEQILYKALMERQDYSKVHAKIAVQMLMGFTEEERARPELYSLLIDLLRHEKLAIRGMAYWHLRRLAPAVKVEFNPIGEKAEWEKAHAAYKEKIPTGKLPPSE